MRFLISLLTAAVLGCTSCSLPPAGPMQHDTLRIGMSGVQMAHIHLDVGGGALKVSDGSEELVNARFDYNVPEWKPSSEDDGKGGVTIRQGAGAHLGRNQQNNWTVQLNRDVPMDFTVKMGGGDADLKLGGLNLLHVDMELGAGNLNMDFRGSPKSSYDVRVRGGAGDATVYLPSGVGIEATATGGIGGIEAEGLHKDGDRYTNDALGRSKITVRLDVEGGVGSIRLVGGK